MIYCFYDWLIFPKYQSVIIFSMKESIVKKKQCVRKNCQSCCHQWDHINSWNIPRYHWWAWLYKRRHSPEGKTQFNCMNLQVECVLSFVSNYILILLSQNSLYICTKFTFLSLERYLNFPSYFENFRSCALCNSSISWSQQKPKPTNPNSSHFQ